MSFNFLILLLFLPSASVLGWLLLNRLVARRTSTYILVQLLMLDLLLFFTADGLYSVPGINTRILVYSHLVTVFSAPCVIPLIWLIFDRVRYGNRLGFTHFIWLLIPVSLTLSSISLTDTIGAEQLSPFIANIHANGTEILDNYRRTTFGHYYAWSHTIFRFAVGGELLVAVAYLVGYAIKQDVRFRHLIDHFRKDAPIRVIELQLFILIIPASFVLFKVILSKQYIDTHLWVSVLFAALSSIGVFLFNVSEWFSQRKTITRTQAKHVMMYNYNPDIKGPIIEIMLEELIGESDADILLRLRDKVKDRLDSGEIAPKDMNAVKDLLFNAQGNAWDDSLLTRFRSIMLSEQLFLKPSLSLQDIAERLHTNKTYISKLVNNTYNMGFPEFLNTLRVDYAQQYIRNHPNAKQEEIALASGFLSASSFNNIFRKITGTTPKTWLLTADRR